MKNKIAAVIFFAFILSFPLAGFAVLNVTNSATSLRILSVTDIDPDSLSPGESATLKITVENGGDYAAKNVLISWSAPPNTIQPIGVGNTASVGTLTKGSEETAEFKSIRASSSAEPGLYQIAILLTYEVNGTPVLQEASAGIKIGGDTDFKVMVSDVQYQEITLAILNIGKNPADSVAVSIPKQNGYEPIGSAALPLGTLARSDYVVVPFELKVKDGTKDLEIDISYTDTEGTSKTVTKTVELESTQVDVLAGKNLPKKSNTPAIVTLACLVIAALGIGFYLYQRRKKRRNETN